MQTHHLEGICRRGGFHLPKSTMWDMQRLDEVVVVAPIIRVGHRRRLSAVPSESHLALTVPACLANGIGSPDAYHRTW